MPASPKPDLERARPSRQTDAKNRRIAIGVVGFSVAMSLFAIFAVPPAYRLFCQVTGWGGTPQRAEAASREILERTITIQFDANQATDLPWRFRPQQTRQTLKVGETGLALYLAENEDSVPVTGRATYNVSPAKAGQYFQKIDCFCFTEQRLEAGQIVDMPVAYFVDPAIDDDPNMDEIETITLSYSFYRYDDGETTGQNRAP